MNELGIHPPFRPDLVVLHPCDLGGGVRVERHVAHLGFIDGVFLLVVGGLGMSAPVTAGFGAFHWITSRGLHVVYGLTLEQGAICAMGP
ncbi:MAG: hypothetical protein R2751_00290 [Bacteroidales bacterium]